MKNNVLKYYIAVFYLGFTYKMFAQPGDGNGGTGDGSLEGADTPAPIDNYVCFLAFIGLIYVFMKFRDLQNKKIV
jgi:hypothetical protein